MEIGLTYDLRKDYLEMGYGEEETAEFDKESTVEGIERALQALDKNEINKIIEEDGKAEIICHFCNKKYLFSKEDLINLVNKN